MKSLLLAATCYLALVLDTACPGLWEPLPGPPECMTLAVCLIVLLQRGTALVLWFAIPGLLLDATGTATPGVNLAAAALTGTVMALLRGTSTRLAPSVAFLLTGLTAAGFQLLRQLFSSLLEQSGPLPPSPVLTTELLTAALLAATVLTAGLLAARTVLAFTPWQSPRSTRRRQMASHRI